ncbi:MAG: ChaN family lipoprotein [Phycisphaerae bacterium]
MGIYMNRHAIILLLVLPGLCHCQSGNHGEESQTIKVVEAEAVVASEMEILVDHVVTTGLLPAAFLATKLRDHDLILLGETHQKRQNCQFVAQSLEPLYRTAGLRALITEFINSEKNDSLQQLVTADSFDHKLATALMRDYGTGVWGFREYRDILHSAWALNQSLEAGEEQLQVIGMDNSWGSQPPTNDRMKQFQNRLAREKHMIDVVRVSGLKRGMKAIVHVGRDHTYLNQGVRLGTVLYKEFGARITQVVLHHEYPSRSKPAPIQSLIEDVIKRSGKKAIGFDIQGSPFAMLRDRNCGYWMRTPETNFGDIMQSMIFLAPVSEMAPTRWMPGFITEENFDRARRFAEQVRWIDKDEVKSPGELDQVLLRRFPTP